MTAPAPKALTLQRPLADSALGIVARGKKSDGQLEDQSLALVWGCEPDATAITPKHAIGQVAGFSSPADKP